MASSESVKTSTSAKSISSSATATAGEFKQAWSPTVIQSLGPRFVLGSIIFVASFPQANTVCIAGDFNDWNPGKTPMKKSFDGSWQASVRLAKGIYKYLFVVDGNWQQDPHNNQTEPNEYGGLNSVLRVV
jgi:1,4-alpha-glucan branching enzyme